MLTPLTGKTNFCRAGSFGVADMPATVLRFPRLLRIGPREPRLSAPTPCSAILFCMPLKIQCGGSATTRSTCTAC